MQITDSSYGSNYIEEQSNLAIPYFSRKTSTFFVITDFKTFPAIFPLSLGTL